MSPLAISACSPRILVTSCDIVVAWVPSQVHKNNPADVSEFATQLNDLVATNKKILETLLHQLSVQSAMLQQMLRAATTFTEVAQLAELSTTSESFK